MTREQEIEKAARDLIRAYGYSVTPGDPMSLNEYEALQELRRVCGFPRGVLPAAPPPSAQEAQRCSHGVLGGCCDGCRAVVAICTKNAAPPPSATAAPEVEVCVGCGKPWPCEHAAVKGHLDAATAAEAPSRDEDRCRCKPDGAGGCDSSECRVNHPPASFGEFNVPPRPAGEEKCPACYGNGINMRCARCDEIVSPCEACSGTGRAPSRGEVG